jgi:hypothetical protein
MVREILFGMLTLSGENTPVTALMPGPDHVPPIGEPVKVDWASSEQYVGLFPEIVTIGSGSTVTVWNVSCVHPFTVTVYVIV